MTLIWRSLSGRLLFLTVAFVLLAEVLIFIPSSARFREAFLTERLEKGRIAALAATEARDRMLSPTLQAEVLRSAGLLSVALERDGMRQQILRSDMPGEVEAKYDLREAGAATLIADAIGATFRVRPRVIRVVGAPPSAEGDVVDIVLNERELQAALYDYCWRIVQLSLLISAFTASLVFLSVNYFLLKPIKRVTSGIMRFREDPEDASRVLRPSGATGEIGDAERELARTQAEVVAALKQKSRLAALGEAVAKINHDLRNMLASSQLLADRLEVSQDPLVRKVGPKLIASLDRAIRLCQQTLAFGKAEEPPPERRETRLFALIEDVRAALGLAEDGPARDPRISFENAVDPEIALNVDADQIFRALLNLTRNAVQALESRREAGRVAVSFEQSAAGPAIDVIDDGPGLPAKARENLFKAFKGSQRAGGSGLGLAIAAELVRAHGGALSLEESGPGGVRFRITLPDDCLHAPAASALQSASASERREGL